jgi:hypothetical protein
VSERHCISLGSTWISSVLSQKLLHYVETCAVHQVTSALRASWTTRQLSIIYLPFFIDLDTTPLRCLSQPSGQDNHALRRHSHAPAAVNGFQKGHIDADPAPSAGIIASIPHNASLCAGGNNI